MRQIHDLPKQNAVSEFAHRVSLHYLNEEKPYLAHQINHGHQDADGDYDAAQEEGLDAARQAPAEHAAGQGTDCHHQGHVPHNLPGKDKENGRREVNTERDGLFEGVQAGQGIFQYQT